MWDCVKQSKYLVVVEVLGKPGQRDEEVKEKGLFRGG